MNQYKVSYHTIGSYDEKFVEARSEYEAIKMVV